MIFLRNDDGTISVDGGEFAPEADFSVHLLGQAGDLLETTIRLTTTRESERTLTLPEPRRRRVGWTGGGAVLRRGMAPAILAQTSFPNWPKLALEPIDGIATVVYSKDVRGRRPDSRRTGR